MEDRYIWSEDISEFSGTVESCGSSDFRNLMNPKRQIKRKIEDKIVKRPEDKTLPRLTTHFMLEIVENSRIIPSKH